jgi:multicomponent Na+:H+ antiporter subunit G
LLIDALRVMAIVIGVFFMFVAALGVLRLSDFYQRIHAPTKAATLGLMFLLIAVTLSVQEKDVVTKAVLAMLFIAATAPVGAHLLARAAYRNGVPASANTELDEYAPVPRARRADRAKEPNPPPDLNVEDGSTTS